jgi:hypothetical protein
MNGKQQETFVVETKIGPVELPIDDENWHEYSQAERDYITEVIQFFAEGEAGPEALKECIGGLTARELTNFESFEEAKKASNGGVVLEGDWGGQIYLTCPLKYVKCDEQTLKKLLREIDNFEWDCNEGDGTHMTYIRANAGDGVGGGMGGGVVEDGLWIHPDIADDKKELIKKVINGELTSIN